MIIGPKISLTTESQCDCRVSGKPVQPRDLCDKSHEWQVEARVEVLFEFTHKNPHERERPRGARQ
jgi:hypothetical protein